MAQSASGLYQTNTRLNARLREAQGAHRRTDQQRAGDNLAAASAGERESFLLENGRRSKYSQTLLSERSVRR